MQDFISRTTFEFNSFFDAVRAAGGLHKFMSIRGGIILSGVMRDDIIAKFTPERHAEAIRVLKPDAVTSGDGETYEQEHDLSRKEIARCLEQTKMLMALCPGIPVIGQVKGCSRRQIRDHCQHMKKLGIQDFMFHTGDFLRNGDANMIAVARGYALEIRREARMLFLYGLGSPRLFLEFSFADAFITYKHCIEAMHGKKQFGNRTEKRFDIDRAQLIVENFKELQRCARELNQQTKLFVHGGVCIWEEVIAAEDHPTHQIIQAEAS